MTERRYASGSGSGVCSGSGSGDVVIYVNHD